MRGRVGKKEKTQFKKKKKRGRFGKSPRGSSDPVSGGQEGVGKAGPRAEGTRGTEVWDNLFSSDPALGSHSGGVRRRPIGWPLLAT